MRTVSPSTTSYTASTPEPRVDVWVEYDDLDKLQAFVTLQHGGKNIGGHGA